jgi:hypothetical protein
MEKQDGKEKRFAREQIAGYYQTGARYTQRCALSAAVEGTTFCYIKDQIRHQRHYSRVHLESVRRYWMVNRKDQESTALCKHQKAK